LIPQQDDKPIEGTIFESYDTIIFDLDGTVWDCYAPDGTYSYAAKMVPPFKLITRDIVQDLNGSIAKLQEGVQKVLEELDRASKNMGVMSGSELENRPPQAQPAMMLLRKFDLYGYFNEDVIIRKGDKREYVKALGHTLFIDDNQNTIQEVNALGDVDVLWRGSFQTWDTLLQKKNETQSALRFGQIKTARRAYSSLKLSWKRPTNFKQGQPARCIASKEQLHDWCAENILTTLWRDVTDKPAAVLLYVSMYQTTGRLWPSCIRRENFVCYSVGDSMQSYWFPKDRWTDFFELTDAA
jgi:predicted phosphatase